MASGGRSGRVVVVGGGIAGLATGVAMQRIGLDVAVFERAPELREIGAALGVQSNAMKALQYLGLGKSLLRTCPPVHWQEFQADDGRMLARLPVGEITARVGAPVLVAHRRELHAELVGGIDPASIHLGARCVGFHQDDAGVTARFADGREERGALLVGADGINSAVRQRLLGDPPLYAGYIYWRGITHTTAPPFPIDVIRMVLGRGGAFFMSHIGKGRVYWSALKQVPRGSTDGAGGRKQEILDKYRGYPEPVEALVRGSDEGDILSNEIFDRDPVARWGEGRVTLLGDAAHLTSPNMGQGAGIAIEDAVVLAKNLALAGGELDGTSVRLALQAYERQRIPRTTAFVLEARRRGITYVWDNPVRCFVRNTILRLTPDRVWRKRLWEVLAHEP